MSIAGFLVSRLGPAVIVDVLRKQDAYALGKDLSGPVEKALDKEFGEKKSEVIQNELLPFMGRLLHGFKDGLEGK